jgi:hypothetical protein
VEHVGADQDQGRLPVGTTQRPTTGGPLGLGAGGGEQPEHLVEQLLVGTDDEGPGGRRQGDCGRGAEEGHAHEATASAAAVADLDEICG